MAKYTGNYQGITLSTTLDLKTLVTTATLQGSILKLIEAWFSGEAGSSTVGRIGINRPSAVGVTINGTQTPEKTNPASVGAAFSLAGTATAVSNWGTQPVLT